MDLPQIRKSVVGNQQAATPKWRLSAGWWLTFRTKYQQPVLATSGGYSETSSPGCRHSR